MLTLNGEDIEYLKTLFVSRETCDNKMTIQDDRFDALSGTLRELQVDATTTKRLVWGILGAAVTIAIKLIFG